LLLIWCAKEALYKAIGQKGTDFRIHLQIEPIATHPETSIANSAESMFNSVSEINNHTINIAQFDTNGIIQAEIKLPGFEQKIQLPYLRWDDYACVWAVL
jgi:phosphopantetheinyl transferase (holo-ACP synthase)